MPDERRIPSNTPPDDSIGLITTVTVVVLAGGLVLPILFGSVGRTCGARSSMRLEHQQRQAEIQRALAQQAAAKRADRNSVKP
jgi:hypothetical protein